MVQITKIDAFQDRSNELALVTTNVSHVVRNTQGYLQKLLTRYQEDSSMVQALKEVMKDKEMNDMIEKFTIAINRAPMHHKQDMAWEYARKIQEFVEDLRRREQYGEVA